MASLLNFLKQKEMSWFAACTTFSANIWSLESMPSDWCLSLLCPVFKKGDATVCGNYRVISSFTIAYRGQSSVLCERLKPFVNKLIDSYPCGFRPGKATIDQIFTLRQILKKTRDKQINTFHLFVDFKSAFDTPHRITYTPPCHSVAFLRN